MLWHICRKEIVSTLRDRRTIISSLVIPLFLLPLVMLGLPLLLGGLFEREQETVTELGVLGIDYLPTELRDLLESQNLRLVSTDEPQTAVEQDDFLVALALSETFEAQLLAGEQISINLYSKRGSLRSDLNASKVQEAIRSYSQNLVAARLAAEGLSQDILQPIRITPVDASSEAERSSGQLAWLIPFFIAVWTLAGGQAVALDATAGEKERGTLEALLVSPIRRVEVVVGKFFATLIFGLAAAVMAIVGYILGGTVLRTLFLGRLGDGGAELVTMMGGSLSVSFDRVVLLLVTALLLSAVIAAVLMTVSLFARSYKEAQTYVAPLSFVLIIPAIGLQFSEFFGSNLLVYLVPVLNALLLMDDVVKGKLLFLPTLLTWGSLLLVTMLLLDVAYRNFKREAVIFRT